VSHRRAEEFSAGFQIPNLDLSGIEETSRKPSAIRAPSQATRQGIREASQLEKRFPRRDV
jgi:hypothetical protein